MSNGTGLAKKRFVMIALLLLIILIIPLVQGWVPEPGCMTGDSTWDVIGRYNDGLECLDDLREERAEQRSTMEAMQSQANNLEGHIGVAQSDVALAEEEVEDSQQEIEDKQQEIKDKQAEIDDIEQKMEEVAQEIEDIEAPFIEWIPPCKR